MLPAPAAQQPGQAEQHAPALRIGWQCGGAVDLLRLNMGPDIGQNFNRMLKVIGIGGYGCRIDCARRGASDDGERTG